MSSARSDISKIIFLARPVVVLAAAVLFFISPRLAASGEEIKGPAPGKKPVTVYSDRMEADRGDGRVVFMGNVVAEEDFTLCSEELAISYGSDKEIDEVTARGNVRIFHGEKTSLSEAAVYDRKKRVIVLTGGASVRQCADTVRGEKITVYIDSDRAVVESEGGRRVRALIMPDKKCPESERDSGGAAEVKREKGESGEARCQRPR